MNSNQIYQISELVNTLKCFVARTRFREYSRSSVHLSENFIETIRGVICKSNFVAALVVAVAAADGSYLAVGISVATR